MALTDYTLERFPDLPFERLELTDDLDQCEFGPPIFRPKNTHIRQTV